MDRIVRAHFPSVGENLIRQAMGAFYMVRRIPGIQKKPGTSELIDWIQALQIGGVDPSTLSKEIPFAGVLLKKNEDLEKLNPDRDKTPWRRR
jgi:MoxR-like ATPase